MHARTQSTCMLSDMHAQSFMHTHTFNPPKTPRVPSESAQSVCACVHLVSSGVRPRARQPSFRTPLGRGEDSSKL